MFGTAFNNEQFQINTRKKMFSEYHSHFSAIKKHTTKEPKILKDSSELVPILRSASSTSLISENT